MEKWITKSTEILGSYTNDIYTYSTYEDAVADTGMKQWFDTLPGEVTDVTYTYAYCDNDYTKLIDVVAEYNGSEDYLNEEIWGGNVADDVTVLAEIHGFHDLNTAGGEVGGITLLHAECERLIQLLCVRELRGFGVDTSRIVTGAFLPYFHRFLR